MLGQYLEFSISARPLAPEHQFYRALGFQDLLVGDILDYSYAALWDGSVTVGLHEADFERLTLTFVRPDLKDHIRALRSRFGIDFTAVETSDEVFNRADFEDPSGQPVCLVEARTYSPATRETSSISACGSFLELSLPTHAVAESRAFWERLGFTVVAESQTPHPWARLAGHGIVLGVHESSFKAGLSFTAADLEARKAYLAAQSFAIRSKAPFTVGSGGSGYITSPAGLPIYLLETDG